MPIQVILCAWILSAGLSPLVQAQVHALGASHPVVVLAGEDVTLPCLCDPPVDLEPLMVEWSRTELKPDPSDQRVRFVHVYMNRQEDLDMKLQDFTNRTQLFPELRAGNASLRIQRVRLTDNGTYKCFIPKLRTEAYATLIVLDPAEAVIPKDADEEDQPFSPLNRLALPKYIAIAIFGALCVGILIFIGARNIISKKTRALSSEDDAENGAADRPKEQLLTPESLPNHTQRLKLQAR